MGQIKSKHDSNASSQPLTNTASDSLTAAISHNQSSQSISYPAAPRTLTRLSELIDPYELFGADTISPMISSEASPQASSPADSTKRVMVQSPSGNMLSASEFLERPDRKLTLAERRKAIEERTRHKIETKGLNDGDSMGVESEGRRSRMIAGPKAKGWFNCFSCFR